MKNCVQCGKALKKNQHELCDKCEKELNEEYKEMEKELEDYKMQIVIDSLR